MNGTKGGAPATGISVVPTTQVIDADMHDPSHGAFLTDDGGVYYTTDGWDTLDCVNCNPVLGDSEVNPALNGVAIDGLGALWAVGDHSLVEYSSSQTVPGKPTMGGGTIDATTPEDGNTYDLVSSQHNYYDAQLRRHGRDPDAHAHQLHGRPPRLDPRQPRHAAAHDGRRPELDGPQRQARVRELSHHVRSL